MSKLNDYCTKITDGEHGTVKDDPNGNYFLLSNKNIVNNEIQITEKDRHINEKTFNRINERTCLKQGSVLIATVGTIGKTMVVKNKPNYTVQRSVGVINPNPKLLDSDFLKYYLDTPFIQKKLSNSVKGAVQKCLFIGDLQDLEVDIPDIINQKKIINILSKIDSKITLNNKINNNLQQQAKLLYDYWFNQFMFPNEEGKPYKASGGKMVWNEELKREIPEGWEVKTIDDLMKVHIKKIKTTEINGKAYVPIEMIPRNKISFHETAPIDKASTGLCEFDIGSILLSNRRVYFHKVSISPFDGITRDTVIILKPKNDNNLGYTYQLINSNHFIDYATLNSYGSEQPVLSSLTVLHYKIPYPNNSLDIRYSSLAKKYIDKILELERESKLLTGLRDFLLPMLMSGQATILD